VQEKLKGNLFVETMTTGNGRSKYLFTKKVKSTGLVQKIAYIDKKFQDSLVILDETYLRALPNCKNLNLFLKEYGLDSVTSEPFTKEKLGIVLFETYKLDYYEGFGTVYHKNLILSKR
jgi:hypothetical protein